MTVLTHWRRRVEIGLLICAFVIAMSPILVAQKAPNQRNLGSAYIPLEHWSYPVIERAIARGAIPTQFLGLRPWTRMSIASLLEQRRSDPDSFAQDSDSTQIVAILEKEFAYELSVFEGARVKDAQLTSLYTRLQGISGDSLRDSFHLGQTIVNDNGRPYGNGFNNVTGGGASADYGMFTAVLSGEYRHASKGTIYAPSVQAALAHADLTAGLIAPDLREVNHGTFQETYVGATWRGWDLSTGKEEVWWGTPTDSSLTLTNNAEPMFMGRVDRVLPLRFPWIFRYLGDVRMDFFMGRLEGHQYPAGPWLHGEKISLMPTKNLEVGFARTTVWLGTGRPFSWSYLARTYFSVGDQAVNSNSIQNDPGDRRGELDVRYRVPGVRNSLTVYFDSLVDDDPSPLASPHRAAFHPGFFVTRLPHLSKVDLRAEAAFTQLTVDNQNGRFFYWNTVYHDAYLNNGLLLGDWVGREGIGGQITARYWLTPASNIEVFYKHNQIATDFVPGGGYQEDLSARTLLRIRDQLFVSGILQYEQYRFPILATGTHSNFTTSIGLTFIPGPKRGIPQP